VIRTLAAVETATAELARSRSDDQGNARAAEDLVLSSSADAAANGRPVGYGPMAIRLPRCAGEQAKGQSCEK
jgi:hypothetical protein